MLPLLAWYAWGMEGLARQVVHDTTRSWTGGEPRLALAAASKTSILLFMGLQTVLFVVRRLPAKKYPGAPPRLAAAIGALLPYALFALPSAHPGAVLYAVSGLLVLSGTIFAIRATTRLGRSFAVFPQARGLVLGGIYRRLRHPVYLGEQTAVLGAMLQFAQPWAALVALASVAAQFPRMSFEERLLRETYPDYAAYEARTWRIVPGLY
ncbi:MAG: isoprenylcysteine carboxylmethyltransferase family protein [Elusimicrobia bacterium]|nr:isoprenylcysteine carboxylmethyltransferase family protein [Elusimicrobiota bacterium]